MTSKARRSGGQSSKPAEKPAEDQAAEQEAATVAAAQERAEEQGKASDNVAGDGEQPAAQPEQPAGGDTSGPVQRAADATADTLQVPGDPEPAKIDKGMVRPETGISPEVPEGDVPTAPFGDDERNGKPTGIGTDTSGELRQREDAVPTAAHGQDVRNGHVTGMDAEGQIDRGFGGNGDSAAKLAGSGVRAETGAGTLDPDLPADERPTYPSTTLTRANAKAAPMEPEDVKHATEPKLGNVHGSTDPTMAAAAMPSMPGDVTVSLVNRDGDEVKPSDFFEVPDGVQARSFRRVKHRVSEVFTVRKVATPGRRLLFTEGQMVPVDVAETLIRLHG